MPLLLQAATEADLERLVTIQFTSFGHDPLCSFMFQNPPTNDMVSYTAGRYRNDMLNPKSCVYFHKVVDTELDNEIIAFSKWNIYPAPRPESEWKIEDKRTWGEGTHIEAADYFLAKVDEARKRILGGRAHAMLNILDTHPDHQRRGAGAMLVRWGLDRADEVGIPCYVESSMAAHHLYEKNGWVDIGENLDFDLKEWGGPKGKFVLMIRPVKGQSTGRAA